MGCRMTEDRSWMSDDLRLDSAQQMFQSSKFSVRCSSKFYIHHSVFLGILEIEKLRDSENRKIKKERDVKTLSQCRKSQIVNRTSFYT